MITSRVGGNCRVDVLDKYCEEPSDDLMDSLNYIADIWEESKLRNDLIENKLLKVYDTYYPEILKTKYAIKVAEAWEEYAAKM